VNNHIDSKSLKLTVVESNFAKKKTLHFTEKNISDFAENLPESHQVVYLFIYLFNLSVHSLKE